ncbi:hypothetical protein L1987_22237 [Smallanthus sonchifolius]|uniref:Uncharacterized protein n=1 Tax=Smallanthus sonchifolius TaxID=185202 RepID=A0ACB9IF88_9ASTR|nr:hypothetical protein L1987_22237 [Smallanthus sonchifolius]
MRTKRDVVSKKKLIHCSPFKKNLKKAVDICCLTYKGHVEENSTTTEYEAAAKQTPINKRMVVPDTEIMSPGEVESPLQSDQHQTPNNNVNNTVMPQLGRQSSIYSLTLDKFPRVHEYEYGWRRKTRRKAKSTLRPPPPWLLTVAVAEAQILCSHIHPSPVIPQGNRLVPTNHNRLHVTHTWWETEAVSPVVMAYTVELEAELNIENAQLKQALFLEEMRTKSVLKGQKIAPRQLPQVLLG